MDVNRKKRMNRQNGHFLGHRGKKVASNDTSDHIMLSRVLHRLRSPLVADGSKP